MLAIRVPDNVPRAASARHGWNSLPAGRASAIARRRPGHDVAFRPDGDQASRAGLAIWTTTHGIISPGRIPPRHGQCLAQPHPGRCWRQRAGAVAMGLGAKSRRMRRRLLCDKQRKAEIGPQRLKEAAESRRAWTLAAQLPLTIQRNGKRAGNTSASSMVFHSRSCGERHARNSSEFRPCIWSLPGEFLFGYRDEHGYLSSPAVRPAPRRTASGILPALREMNLHAEAATGHARFRPKRIVPRRAAVRATCRRIQGLSARWRRAEKSKELATRKSRRDGSPRK